MSPRRRSKDVRISIDYEEIKDFLRLLADDPEFRRRLQEDPRATLLDYRIDVSAESVPDEITLPDVEETRELLQRITKEFADDPDAAAGVLGYAVLAHVLVPAPSPPPP